MTSPRWKRRPHGSTWGDFGPDDERGRLNLITPEKVRQGVAEVREGLTFCLSLPLEYPGGNVLNPRRHPPVVRPTLRGTRPNFNFPACEEVPDATDVICDDLVVMHLQYSTQWDSLAHVGQLFDADGDGRPEAVYYNGFRAGEDVVGPADGAEAGVPPGLGARTSSQARRLGVHRMAEACMQGRGVMIDLHAHVGRERVVVGYDRLMRVIEADKVAVEEGDMVCLHTGFGALLLELGGTPDPAVVNNACAVLDGRDASAPALDHRHRARLPHRRQLRRRGPSGAPRRGLLRDAAAARALPVPPRRQPRRALAPDAARRLAARERALPLPADGAAAAPHRRGGLAGDAGGDGVRASGLYGRTRPT